MAPVCGELAQARADGQDRSIVEAGERFVEQHQSGAVQERSLEGQPLPHAARKARDLIVGPIDQPRAFERRRSTAAFGSRP